MQAVRKLAFNSLSVKSHRGPRWGRLAAYLVRASESQARLMIRLSSTAPTLLGIPFSAGCKRIAARSMCCCVFPRRIWLVWRSRHSPGRMYVSTMRSQQSAIPRPLTRRSPIAMAVTTSQGKGRRVRRGTSRRQPRRALVARGK
eukprot:6775005-Pyramimonas_sp.AAC.1